MVKHKQISSTGFRHDLYFSISAMYDAQIELNRGTNAVWFEIWPVLGPIEILIKGELS